MHAASWLVCCSTFASAFQLHGSSFAPRLPQAMPPSRSHHCSTLAMRAAPAKQLWNPLSFFGPRTPLETKQVVVIGAGVAGLLCARRLTQAGIDVLLAEASDGIGGRVRSDEVDTPEGKFILDRGFHVFIEAYPEVKKQLDYEALELQKFEPGALVRYQGEFYSVSDPIRRPELLLLALQAPIGTFIDKLKVGIYRVVASLRSEENAVYISGSERDTLSFLKDTLGLSDNMVDKFFVPFYRGIFLSPLETQSSRLFEFVFKMLADGDTSLPLKGIGAIADQMAGRFPEGTVALGTKAVQVDPAPSPSGLATVTLVDSAGEYRVECEAVVVAAEGPAANELLGRKKAPKEETKSVSSTCFYFSLPSPPPVKGNTLILNGELNGDDKAINNIVFLDQVSESYAPAGRSLASVSLPGLSNVADPSCVEDITSQLQEWFPKANVKEDWKLIKTYPIPFAQPAQVISGADKPSCAIPVSQGVYCCGDHRGDPTLNSAFQTGAEVAEAVLSALGRRR
ncbi:unnamed protein product [Chrysoparadoxa australica]